MEGFAYARNGDKDGSCRLAERPARNKLLHCFDRCAGAHAERRSGLQGGTGRLLCLHPLRRCGVARVAGGRRRWRGAASRSRRIRSTGDSEDATDHYHGPLLLFIEAGFGIIRDDADMTVVRKTPAA
jgi:hypothetical protein